MHGARRADVQASSRVITPPGDAGEDWQILMKLGLVFGQNLAYASGAAVREAIAAELASTPGYAELGTTAYADHNGLIGRIDAAIVATPSRFHHRVAASLLAHGVHVFVEKPMTLNVGDADDLIATADAQGLVLQVGHVERFPDYWEITAGSEATTSLSAFDTRAEKTTQLDAGFIYRSKRLEL